MPAAPQSVMMDVLMDSVGTVIRLWSGFDASRIFEYYGQDIPRYSGEQFVSYRLSDWEPEAFSGAGRLAALTEVVLEIRLHTRLATDAAGDQTQWFRHTGRGHWIALFNILDGFDNNNLFSVYNATTKEPSGDLLTIRPLQQLPSPFVKVDPKDSTWGVSPLRFNVATVKPLNQPA